MNNMNKTDNRGDMSLPANERVLTQHKYRFVTHTDKASLIITKELQAKIEEFKSCRVDKPQLEIIEHYKEGLRAVQDALDTVLERWKM